MAGCPSLPTSVEQMGYARGITAHLALRLPSADGVHGVNAVQSLPLRVRYRTYKGQYGTASGATTSGRRALPWVAVVHAKDPTEREATTDATAALLTVTPWNSCPLLDTHGRGYRYLAIGVPTALQEND